MFFILHFPNKCFSQVIPKRLEVTKHCCKGAEKCPMLLPSPAAAGSPRACSLCALTLQVSAALGDFWKRCV